MAVASHGGTIQDIVSGRGPAAGSGTPTNGIARFGRSRNYASTADFFTTPSSLDAPTQYTVISRGSWTSITSFGSLWAKTSNLGTTNGFSLFRNFGSSGAATISHGGTNVSVDAGTDLSTRVSSAPTVTTAFVWTGTRLKFWLNGALISDTALSTAVTSGAGYLKIASSRDTVATTGSHDHTLVWTRGLSDAEASWLTRGDNSYAVFAPVERQIWVPVSAASGIPVLSAATAIDITSTQARPRVTVTFA